MIKKLGKPITGANTQMKPHNPKWGGGSVAASSQVAAPPAPFRNPGGVLKPVPTDGSTNASVTNKNVADGKAKNESGYGGKQMTMDGGIKSSHTSAHAGSPFPKKRFPPSGNKRFYGG